jgi:hypothetical protein
MSRAPIALAVVAVLVAGCERSKNRNPTDDPPPPASSVSTEPTKVPPAAFSGVPVTSFADAGDVDGKPPLAQATAYFANGEVWKARLVLEPKALSEDGTNEEVELLAKICNAQRDQSCLDRCGSRLGRKLRVDAGPGSTRTAEAGATHEEPDTDLARARNLLLKDRLQEAHKILEPKVLDGRASREETRMLRTICNKEGNRMCVALCDSKLK